MFVFTCNHFIRIRRGISDSSGLVVIFASFPNVISSPCIWGNCSPSFFPRIPLQIETHKYTIWASGTDAYTVLHIHTVNISGEHAIREKRSEPPKKEMLFSNLSRDLTRTIHQERCDPYGPSAFEARGCRERERQRAIKFT